MQNSYQTHATIMPKSYRNHGKFMPKSIQNLTKIINMIPQWSFNGPKFSSGGTGIRSPDRLVPRRVLAPLCVKAKLTIFFGPFAFAFLTSNFSGGARFRFGVNFNLNLPFVVSLLFPVIWPGNCPASGPVPVFRLSGRGMASLKPFL